MIRKIPEEPDLQCARLDRIKAALINADSRNSAQWAAEVEEIRDALQTLRKRCERLKEQSIYAAEHDETDLLRDIREAVRSHSPAISLLPRIDRSPLFKAL